jgi:primase-polymerase (primpol)-like protein
MVPPPDDQFEILSEINKATSVMFRLNNRVKSHAKFKAYFTSDSDMEFSISPKSGDLEPFGREGSQF